MTTTWGAGTTAPPRHDPAQLARLKQIRAAHDSKVVFLLNGRIPAAWFTGGGRYEADDLKQVLDVAERLLG